jgi:hypothetical protein
LSGGDVSGPNPAAEGGNIGAGVTFAGSAEPEVTNQLSPIHRAAVMR